MSKRVFLSPIDTHFGRVLFRSLKQQQYDIYAGSRADQSDFKPNSVQKWASLANREALTAAVMECDVIIYDIVEKLEEASFVIEMLSTQRLHEDKTFIALSSVMTWAQTPKKEPEPADEEGQPPKLPPLTEEDLRKRRPHPLYREVLQVERLVARKNRGRLHTAVLTLGLLYGEGEDVLHSYFKQAWEGIPPALPIFGDGSSKVAMVHVRDAATVVDLAIATPLQEPVVLVVEPSPYTQTQIVKVRATLWKSLETRSPYPLQAISQHLGTGEVRQASVDEQLLHAGPTVALLTSDVNVVSRTLAEGGELAAMADKWYCPSFLEGLPSKVIPEYKLERGLTALRLMVTGPPGAGRSTLAARLAAHYKINHVNVKDVVERYRAMAPPPRIAPAEDSAESAEPPAKSLQEEGFVLDGYPRNLQDCQALFAAEKTGEDDQAQPDDGPVTAAAPTKHDPTLLPEQVVVLEATDEFIKLRLMHLPETQVAGTHNTEEGIARRLATYRQQNTADNEMTSYFSERDVHPIPVDASALTEERVQQLISTIGKPHNYGPTAEELAAERRRKEQEEAAQREAAEAEVRRAEEADRAEKQRRHQIEAERLSEIQRQEAAILAERSKPLRKYLMDLVMPTLTKGLLEVAKVRPADPIDYLAEYLFKHTPDEDTEGAPFAPK
ncbi:putative Adenylate kinase 7 [Paratrimastix pyriformis]|uniref:Adenylate kinase 7 n=1 Tax=Paratrimastix pyriformis TaxID=342808 RepID=A0ABQ8UMS1_9EUKA|nr:putative Adenylate kinase 7 [Paratrimastix pyriformis]